MKFLLDTSAASLQRVADHPLVAGQLLTPLTNYKTHSGKYAIDNGAFSGYQQEAFLRLLDRNINVTHNCLFVAVPDVVGNARRTLEIFDRVIHNNFFLMWRRALVVQDGQEDLEIPWGQLDAIFIGGTNAFKDSSHAYDIVKAAKILGVHVHVGRVNSVKRFRTFDRLGADTCDGTGVVRFSHMLDAIAKAINCTEKQLELQMDH